MHVATRFVLTFAFALSTAALTKAQTLSVHPPQDPHSTAEWALIAPHLPDPVLSGPDKLETTGDVLRARRFPDDALTYYKAASINGGNTSRLLKKQGVVHMELQHGLIARLCFQQALRLNKKDAEAWNNLGASDFMLGNTREAVGEYKHAVKLNRTSAVYHSNLSLAYFENHDGHNARLELARAFALDPEILHHTSSGGYNLQILGSTHYAEICFEMARMYAAQGDLDTTINWLTKASERGFDVRSSMRSDPVLLPYLENDRVKVMLSNYDQRHSKELARIKPPGLAAGSPQ